MARQRKLKNAPIKETLLDFRFSQRLSSVDDYNAVLSELAKDYPNSSSQMQMQVSGNFPSKDGEAAAIEQKSPIKTAVQLMDENRRVVIQLGLSSITFNIIKDYSSFEELFELKAFLIGVCEDNQFDIPKISRIGVRTINRLEIDIDDDKPLASDVRYLPLIPPEWPNELETFRLQSTFHEKGRHAIVANSIERFDADNSRIYLNFDVDCFTNIEELDIRKEKINEIVSELRDLKNTLFFEAFSDRVLDKYDE